jgi:hypothetical protein
MCHPAAQTHTLETCPDLSMNAGTIHTAQVFDNEDDVIPNEYSKVVGGPPWSPCLTIRT